MAGETAHMKLVDHGLCKRPSKRQIPFPVIAAGISHDTFHRHRRVVAGPASGYPVVGFRYRYGETIRIDKNLLAIEPKPTFRRKWPMGPVGINLPRFEVRHKGMPVVIGTVAILIERK